MDEMLAGILQKCATNVQAKYLKDIPTLANTVRFTSRIASTSVLAALGWQSGQSSIQIVGIKAKLDRGQE